MGNKLFKKVVLSLIAGFIITLLVVVAQDTFLSNSCEQACVGYIGINSGFPLRIGNAVAVATIDILFFAVVVFIGLALYKKYRARTTTSKKPKP